jgi:hypothetical protein
MFQNNIKNFILFGLGNILLALFHRIRTGHPSDEKIAAGGGGATNKCGPVFNRFIVPVFRVPEEGVSPSRRAWKTKNYKPAPFETPSGLLRNTGL